MPSLGPRFAKRATDEPPATASDGLSIQSLQIEVNSIHRSLKELVTERERLALPALKGDTTAIAKITEIDGRRLHLTGRLETLTAGIRRLHEEHRSVGWRHRLPHLTRCARIELHQQWQLWPERLAQLLIGRQPHDVIALRDALTEFEQLERTVAREVADRLLPEARMPFHTAGDQDALLAARREHDKLKEQRQRTVSEAVAAILADTASLKRPRALDEALAAARHRLEVEAKAKAKKR